MILPVALLACAVAADAAPHRRALLIGIDDYSASHITQLRTPAPGREWANLGGAVNDVRAFAEALVVMYGFDGGDIATVTDQAATRDAILAALEAQAIAAERGDTLFVYFAGHGSQVRNGRSAEPDKLDESIVPADSRRGAADIRDKELRRVFNRILDRGARLTVFIDACHSGSGARGDRADLRVRALRPDLRDVADGADYGPRPEDRGALVISASHDYDNAWEMQDRGIAHGAFSWAWLRAIAEAAPGEPASDTFLRAQGRLRGELPFQQPLLAGNASARRAPFLGDRAARGNGRAVVAVERVRPDGVAVLNGGWASGLRVGNVLRGNGGTVLTVTALTGVARSEARANGARPRAGALFGTTVDPARRIRSWRALDSPASEAWDYHLAITDEQGSPVADGAKLRGGSRYRLALRATATSRVEPRHVYIFVIDSAGRSILLYPRNGSVENRFPIDPASPPRSVALDARFEIAPPYGTDTYCLLTTDEALPDPSVLESGDRRSAAAVPPVNWSIERLIVESVPPQKRRRGV